MKTFKIERSRVNAIKKKIGGRRGRGPGALQQAAANLLMKSVDEAFVWPLDPTRIYGEKSKTPGKRVPIQSQLNEVRAALTGRYPKGHKHEGDWKFPFGIDVVPFLEDTDEGPDRWKLDEQGRPLVLVIRGEDRE